MRRLALVAVLLLAPGLAHAQDLACGPDGREIVDVDFSGNLRFRGGELENAIVTTPSSWLRRVLHIPVGARHCLDSLELMRDEVRLRLFYRLRGLYKTTVDAAVTPRSPTDSSAVGVLFRIVEGPPVIIDTLDIGGLDSVPPGIRDRALRLLTPFRNRIYNKLLLQAATDSVVTLLQNTGYAYAAEPLRDISVDNATDRASVQLTFLPGHRAHIARVEYSLQGNEPNETPKIDSTTVRRLLSFHKGDLYRQTDLLISQRDLYGLETYRHVDVELLPDSLQPSDTALTVLVRLGEAKMNSMRAGVGWASLDCARAQARYTDRDFLGAAKRLEVEGRLSRIALCTPEVRHDIISSRAGLNYYVSGTLRFPALFGPRNVPSLTLFSERTSEFQTYIRYTPIGGAAQVTRDLNPRVFRPGLPLTIGYRIEYGRTDADPAVFCQLFNRCSLADIARLTRNSYLQVASLALSRDRTDNLLNPSQGSQEHVEFRHGLTAQDTGGTAQFSRLFADAALYRQLGVNTMLAARLEGGTVVAGFSFRGATDFVPPQERLYAGGPNSVRGYNQNLLGPIVYIVRSFSDSVTRSGGHIYQARDTATVAQFSPTGGNTLLVGNLEIRRRSPFLSDILQLAAFVDAGVLWNRPKETVSWSSVRFTPGVGVRVQSPVGPFRVDVAYNPYALATGAAYFSDPTTNVLRCVSPGNTFDRGEITAGSECPTTFRAAKRSSLFSRLTFNFSIGQAF